MASDSEGVQDFSGYPQPIFVKPFKLRPVDMNDPGHWLSEFTLVDPSTSNSKVSITLKPYDSFGNPIGLQESNLGDLSICSSYPHPRFIFYFKVRSGTNPEPFRLTQTFSTD